MGSPRVRGQVKEQMQSLIKSHPDWIAEEIIEATQACFPGQHIPSKSYVSNLRHEMGMGRFSKQNTEKKAKAIKADEQLRFIPSTVEGKVHLLKVVAEALEKQLAANLSGREILRRLADDGVGPGHPTKDLYREAR